MPYTAKGKCVYRKDTGKKVGCTKGSVKKYLSALHANVKDVNESEEFDWVKDSIEEFEKRPAIMYYHEIQNLLEGTEFSISMAESRTGDGIIFRLHHLENGVNLTIDAWSEKFFKPNVIEEDLLSQINHFEDDTGDSYSAETYRDLYNFLRPFFEKYNNINESEEFDWVEIPELPKDNDFISSVKYALEGSPYELIEKGGLIVLHKKISQLGSLVGDSLVIKKRENFTPKNVKYEFDNVFNNLKNQEKMLGPDGISHNPRTFPDLFFKIEKLRKLYFGAYELIKDLLPKDGINESEDDDLNWVQDITKYLKVGQEFSIVRQLGGEPIKAKITRLKIKPNPLYTVFYFVPSSMANSTKIQGTPMTAQKLLDLMNKGYWTPIERNINESEDDFEWAQETIKNSFLKFNGKEILIDIRGLDIEELKRLYDIIIPYVQTNSTWFTTHEGEEIIWNDNTKCFDDMLIDGVGNKKSISLHCGLEDNDYLPLEGALCCLSGTYDDEPSHSKENIIPVNAREIIGGTINESEWFEDVVKDPIMLKVEDLEMGDIVIPTCFKQEEFVVTSKGTSVKMLHALRPQRSIHWVTLKRNTKENTGGVYIEHDSEIGKACRFELIHREENLNESEEDSELFWAEDLLKGMADFVDITDKLDIMEELPLGSILKVNGYQDEMELDMEEVKLIDKAENQGYETTYYLFKLKKERFSDGSEMTHCGYNSNHRKICDCREGTDDELGQTEVGKCWWIELKNQDQVLYYPNRVDLTENKIKKPLLTEGRYDAITRKVVKDIMKLVTTNSFGDHDLPYDANNEEYEYQQENLGFNVELQIIKTRKVEDFFIDAATSDNDEDETVMLVKVFLNPTFDKQNLEKVFYKLQEIVRHEIEHFTQHGPYRIEDRPTYKGDTAKLKTVYGHHKNVIEIPALVHGFYRRAKLEKRPIDEIMMEDLDSEIEKGFLTKKQAQRLLTLWVDYAKKNLPSAVYKQD